MSETTILVADDEEPIRVLLCNFLQAEGFAVVPAANGREVMAKLVQAKPDVALLDIRMPGMDGLEVLQRLREQQIDTPVIFITAHGSASSVIKAIQMGAFDYIVKPFDLDHVLLTVNRCLEYWRLSQEVADLRAQFRLEPSERIVGMGPKMQEVYKTIGRVAGSEATVLVTGETGTGKELVARTLHLSSPRRQGPLVTVPCASLPETLLESELFGHEKGSFTSAVTLKKGRFELAHKGSIFLDEIGEMSLGTQKKLLRVLQEREFERVGGTTPIQVDVRVIAATNKNLAEEMARGRFREDLFYRLNVVTIHLPPLRERPEDIPLLIQHFLDKYRFSPESPPSRISQEAVDRLVSYEWPGNVRQLENAIQRAVVLTHGGVITGEHLSLSQEPEARLLDVQQKVRDRVPMAKVVAEVERLMIEDALAEAKGDYTLAAGILGTDLQVLQHKLRRRETVRPSTARADDREAHGIAGSTA